jgi:hypothetical protein
MKMYCFQPGGHGETSAFVLAETEEEARRFVLDAAEKEDIFRRPDLDGFETDYYEVKIVDKPGEVIWNAND